MSSSSSIKETLHHCLTRGIPLDPLPSAISSLDSSVPHAPKRTPKLTESDIAQALKNVLRYIPNSFHALLAEEFLHELRTYGHIYAYRFRPTEYEIRAYSFDDYPGKCTQAKAIMLMIMNNLDKAVAQFPYELVTYGGNGSVLNNWLQYHLLMKYLSELTDHQTLSMYSGHPMGIFPSHENAPRIVLTNGMMIPNYSTKEIYDKLYATGVTMYGQMTAGSFCYIGPQGIVHGTTITILNAARKYLSMDNMTGRVFVSSGLGGMSGAQGKAAVICGGIACIAEIDPAALHKRHSQGWIQEYVSTLEECITRLRKAREEKKPLALGYLGNVVDLWERLAEEKEIIVELGSDQTSLHNPYNGGYYPVGLSFADSKRLMSEDPSAFKLAVQASLRRHVAAINKLVARGSGFRFFDYGNAFLLEASRAHADILGADGHFKYPSYVQAIMGDVFSLGFGPFRWVCTSNRAEDLAATDAIARDVLRKYVDEADVHEATKQQLRDNLLWIEQASANKLVVGSQARILYADCRGRMEIAVAFNEAIAAGRVSAPVVLSRDHHDVSGTDSPFRETSNIRDGSEWTADMAVQNVIGDAMRGATWVALHNGGGVGWGEVMNGGFGLVLDGTAAATKRAKEMLFWDVLNGVSRRAWSGNENALTAITTAMKTNDQLKVTLPHVADADLIAKVLGKTENGDAMQQEHVVNGGQHALHAKRSSIDRTDGAEDDKKRRLSTH